MYDKKIVIQVVYNFIIKMKNVFFDNKKIKISTFKLKTIFFNEK